jgi:general secretion pathway protein A
LGKEHHGKASFELRALGEKMFMYNDFYKFSEEPFALNPDPRFFLLTPNHKKVLDLMVYGITERRGFILLTGEKGTGKTAFVQKLLQTLDPRIKAISIFQPPQSFDQLLEVILRSLKLPVGERKKSLLWRQFIDYISNGVGQDANLAIIADNAQELSKEFLEELRELWNPKPGRLQEVLVARPEIEDKLNSRDLRQLKQRIALRCRLEPLTEEESFGYINHRLNKAGGHIDEIFLPEALSLICLYSRGIPETINILCTKSLWAGYGISKKPVDSSLVKEVLEDSGILPPEQPSIGALAEKLRTARPARRAKRTSLAARLHNVQKYSYGNFYGFSTNPFDTHPDLRFFFPTKNCKEVWNSIIYGITLGKGFTLLTGESGTGKTTLAALLFLYFATRGLKVKVIPIFHTPKGIEEILQTVLGKLGLATPKENKSSMLSELDEDLTRRAQQGETVVLLFDEAQKLKREILDEIRLFANVSPKRPRILQEVFVGDPQFEKSLRSRNLSTLNQRFEVRCHLRPFSMEESQNYIEHRLNRAGSTAAKVFTPRALSLIAHGANGTPRNLNRVCNEALSVGYSQMKEKIDSANVREALDNLGMEKQEGWKLPGKTISWIKEKLGRS